MDAPPQVYLCASAPDTALAETLRTRLTTRGLRLHEGGELGPPSPLDERQRAIDRCNLLLVLVSRTSARSAVVTAEYRYALAHDAPVCLAAVAHRWEGALVQGNPHYDGLERWKAVRPMAPAHAAPAQGHRRTHRRRLHHIPAEGHARQRALMPARIEHLPSLATPGPAPRRAPGRVRAAPAARRPPHSWGSTPAAPRSHGIRAAWQADAGCPSARRR